MRSLKLTLSFMLLFSILWPAVVTEAKDSVKVGKITAVSGKSEVKKSGGTKKFNAFKGMAITQGDTIITGNDGQISLDLDANKEVTIGASTTLTISQLVESAKALGGKTSLKLQNGQVLIKVKRNWMAILALRLRHQRLLWALWVQSFLLALIAKVT